MKYRAIGEHSRRYPIRLMCRALLCLAGSAESRRAVHNRILLSEIRVIHRETYGSPSIGDALMKLGTMSVKTASHGSCGPTGFGPRP